MRKQSFYCLSIILILLSCTETSTITLNPTKGDSYANIGYGVYLPLPSGYKKGKSFKGYQAPNLKGSIEILLERNFKELKNYYSKSAIESRDGSVKRLQPVIVNNNPEAFFVEYYDTPQKRDRYIYVVQKDERVYLIKGFLRQNANDDDKWSMRNAILSAYFDQFQDEETPFSTPHIVSLNTFYYARDNKYPTQEIDSAYFRVTTLKDTNFNNDSARDFLNQKAAEENLNIPSFTYEDLMNGTMFEGATSDETKQIYFMLMSPKKGESILIECIGNKQLNMKAFKALAKSQFLVMN